MTQSPKPAAGVMGEAPRCSWTPSHVAGIAVGADNSAPLIGNAEFTRISPDVDIWDAWPVQDADGKPSLFPGGETLWMALGAPVSADFDARHGLARIHLLARRGKAWTHLGPVMPDGFSPGSREWSGSAVLAEDRRTLRLYFTATGKRGEAQPTFLQQLFRADATLVQTDRGHQFSDWRALAEIVAPDPRFYMASDAGTGAMNTIKAFRDPAYFQDPRDGTHHLFFAASLAGSASSFNGAIGWATAPANTPDAWRIEPPLLDADALNNELERPHVVFHDGLYYLFWSTQQHVFNPDGPAGPTGLFGMVSSRLSGEWEPLNGSALVFANPVDAPRQAYSWLVMPDLEVTSFVDDWGPGDPDLRARRFGATFAPMLHLRLAGASATLEG